MLELSLGSGTFLALLACGPLVFGLPLRARKAVLVILSVGVYFLAMTTMPALMGICVTVVIPYAFFIVMLNSRRKLFWPFTITLLILFVYFKDYSWITNFVLPSDWRYTANILGLSYILFRQLDILIHIKDGKIDNISFVDYLAYLFSFWTILAGPIMRYSQFIDAMKSEQASLDMENSLRFLHRATTGLIKVFFFAALFKDIADSSYFKIAGSIAQMHDIIIVFYFYPLYVYLNFSGYCDVVIASAGWAGFKVPENFDRPYLSRNMIEFWNRWHITLSHWLRDYVFQPLFKAQLSMFSGKNVEVAQYISIFVTFFIAGIWHGTTVNFVIFGLLHGLGMALSMMYKNLLNRIFGKKGAKKLARVRVLGVIENIICMHYVCFTFLFFEYDSNLIWLAIRDLAF